jgi:hypothetical protein
MRRFVMASALALSLATPGCGYNRIQQMDERTEELRGNIEAELMRRSDLIPNLVATVEEAARFEQETQTGVAEARSGLTAARERLTNAVQGRTRSRATRLRPRSRRRTRRSRTSCARS